MKIILTLLAICYSLGSGAQFPKEEQEPDYKKIIYEKTLELELLKEVMREEIKQIKEINENK